MQKTRAPKTFEDLSCRIKLVAGASIILFGAGSPVVLQLNKFRGDIKNNKMTIKARIVEDKLFATKNLYAVNTRNQRWLGQCKEAPDRADVNDQIINFDDDILHPILNCQFNISLPPVFAFVDRSQAHSATGAPLPLTNPKKKRGDKEDGGFQRAKKVDPAFALKENEEWRDFCGVCQDSKPMWGDKKRMCIWWNVCDFCYDNCNNKESHVEDEENPPAKKAELRAWMTKVRASY